MDRDRQGCEITKKAPQVRKELDILDKQIIGLRDNIGMIQTKIHPVLRPTPTGCDKPKDPEALVPLAIELRVFSNRIEECNLLLQEMLNTCEL